jgi:hypothetical protein
MQRYDQLLSSRGCRVLNNGLTCLGFVKCRLHAISPNGSRLASISSSVNSAESDQVERQTLMETVDKLSANYGRGTLKLSSDGAHRAWE